MKSISEMGRAELAAFVQDHLRKKGIDVVLCGGACVSIYSHGKYVSMDLDMVHTGLTPPKRSVLLEAMKEIDFVEDGRYFKHSETRLFVEFPVGPPSVGEEPVKVIVERHEDTGILKIISTTDCVKDRLTWYYHDNDHQCLDQAVLVAQDHQIDLKELERWSIGEGMIDEFNHIKDLLQKKV